VTIANVEGQAYWADRAQVWLEDADLLDVFGGPPGEAAIDCLDPRPGERILDIGCGPGITTIALAQRVKPGGGVLGVDLAPGMVEGARRRAPGLSFALADAQVHDFGETFDGAYSRFGVMFFADPVAAFANIRRAARRLSFCCWQEPLANEWMVLPNVVALGELGAGPPPQDPDQPGPFTLADPDRVRSILTAAGFREIDVVPRNDRVELAERDLATWAALGARHGLAGQLLKDATPETRSRVAAAIEEEFRGRVRDGAVRLTRGVLLVTAR